MTVPKRGDRDNFVELRVYFPDFVVHQKSEID